MRTNKIQISAYFSHPIRGLKGAAATSEDMKLNNELAALVGQMLRNACPALDVYIPAEHEDYVQTAFDRGSHDEHEILEIDKIILAQRDILIAFKWEGVCSNGMLVEIEHAKRKKIPIFSFSTTQEILGVVGRIIEWYYNQQSS